MTELLRVRIGLIGAGNMGRALLGGLRRRGVPASRLLAADANPAAARAVRRRLGVANVSIDELARRCAIVVLAVKPQDLRPVLEQVRRALGARSSRVLVVSIAAGVTLAALQRRLGPVAVIRVMPNLPATVGAGMSAISPGRRATARQRRLARAIFQSVGEVVELPERHLDAVTAVSGSGPAYFFLVCKALTDAGAAHGLPVAVAQRLAVQTALGAARLAARSVEPLEAQIARVASKKGTTEAALKVLRRRRFEHALRAAVSAAAARSREMSCLCSMR